MLRVVIPPVCSIAGLLLGLHMDKKNSKLNADLIEFINALNLEKTNIYFKKQTLDVTLNNMINNLSHNNLFVDPLKEIASNTHKSSIELSNTWKAHITSTLKPYSFIINKTSKQLNYYLNQFTTNVQSYNVSNLETTLNAYTNLLEESIKPYKSYVDTHTNYNTKIYLLIGSILGILVL